MDDCVGVLAQAPIQKYHRLGGLNNRPLFLIVLEAGKYKIKCWKAGSWWAFS
jgi:hypothetical protein